MLRDVKPLNAKQSKQVIEALKVGPTPEQILFKIEARKIAGQMREEKDN